MPVTANQKGRVIKGCSHYQKDQGASLRCDFPLELFAHNLGFRIIMVIR